MTEDKHRNQKIFNLIIHHMQACERLYNIQNQYISSLLQNEEVVSPGLGGDINAIICEYSDTLETQGFFAKKCLRNMPAEKDLVLEDFLAGYKLK